MPTAEEISDTILEFTQLKELADASSPSSSPVFVAVIDVLSHRRSISETQAIYVNEEVEVYDAAELAAEWLAGEISPGDETPRLVDAMTDMVDDYL